MLPSGTVPGEPRNASAGSIFEEENQSETKTLGDTMKRVMIQWLYVGLLCGLGAVGCSSGSEDPSDVGELQDAGPDSSEPDVADEDDAGEDAGGDADADEDPDTGDAGDDSDT